MPTTKSYLLLLNHFILAAALTACGAKEMPKSFDGIALLSQHDYGDEAQTTDRRSSLLQFIETRLTGTSGVYTNLRDTAQAAAEATGHEILSESAGLLMRYYALTGQKQRFDEEWRRTKQIFELSTGFSYRYSPKHNRKYSVNAAVDDLRIIRGLYEAGKAFDEPTYTEEANLYGRRFYEHNVKDGFLYDFHDAEYRTTNDFITLCYIDLKTLALLPLERKQRDAFLEGMLGISKKGYLSDEFPFYETRYEYKTASYRSDKINTVESLLTILALAEVRQHEASSIRYVKEQVSAGTLYGQYTKEGKPATDIRSTAIYAIAAMIGSELGDKGLYEDSIRRMNELQVLNGSSELNGGFGDPGSGQAYSFDNLMALLAYAY
ncbi:Glycosyl hydrolases family 8 [Paenibacillus sp. UNCCL117]|uniref:glycosyl hydrolase family 8 n=1 Tax=unclassified Paenibacillus TaxID=185978 RepID=UPI000886D3F0|nr:MULTISPECIES: glycosyl hydrolase family 8 [unclassified Paenibacillus]SDC17352.1 Glycosyl hydrolases family 8 [Paenibacillus sp. cl123]SFW17992.1 Glycosyl hydrolases family 8 [Paenibacillus sp. UNCCL117]